MKGGFSRGERRHAGKVPAGSGLPAGRCVARNVACHAGVSSRHVRPAGVCVWAVFVVSGVAARACYKAGTCRLPPVRESVSLCLFAVCAAVCALRWRLRNVSSAYENVSRACVSAFAALLQLQTFASLFHAIADCRQCF